ncbi:MAG: hypothetical protein JNL58_06740 [Planctomyces sp.]|nr:hypothetical protein [Planctomyces sp.]
MRNLQLRGILLGLIVMAVCGCDEPPQQTAAKQQNSVSEKSSVPTDGFLGSTGDTKFKKVTRVTDGFVGSDACRQCHGAICDEFSKHPMGRSVSTDPNTFAETPDKASFTTSAGLTYDVVREGDKVEHFERLLNENGESVYARSAEILFAIGSGSRGRSYCFLAADRIYMSPVTWYSRRQTWDLSPGYDPNNHPGFERKASDGCMACHAGRMDSRPDKRDQFNSGVFLEAAIGCERCHGPGAQHVEFQTTKQGADVIVNPLSLSPQKRDAVCFQCHLQGERRVVRYGQDDYGFQPGMNVNEIWVTFVKDGRVSEGKAEAVSQVEQMLSSRCYTASEGKLGCISCHDPHTVPKEEDHASFYRAKCLTCHSVESTVITTSPTVCSLPVDNAERIATSDNCIECHMPSLQATDVPHTAQTDHRVLRRKADILAEDTHEDREFRMPVIFEEAGYEIPEHEKLRARFILSAENLDSAREPAKMTQETLALISQLIPVADDDADLFEAGGLVYEQLRNTKLTENHWKKALEIRGGDDEAILELLATMHHNRGDARRARDYYAQLVLSNDSRPTYFGRFAHVLGQSGQMREGLIAAKRALSLNPGLPQAQFWLSEAYETLGNSAEARYHRAQAEELVRLRTKYSDNQPKSP